MRLYQIYDLVARCPIGPITTATHPAAAIREFTDILRDPKSRLSQHPQDYNLITLGIQSDETGAISAETPDIILSGDQWLKSQERAEGAPISDPASGREPRIAGER